MRQTKGLSWWSASCRLSFHSPLYIRVGQSFWEAAFQRPVATLSSRANCEFGLFHDPFSSLLFADRRFDDTLVIVGLAHFPRYSVSLTDLSLPANYSRVCLYQPVDSIMFICFYCSCPLLSTCIICFLTQYLPLVYSSFARKALS